MRHGWKDEEQKGADAYWSGIDHERNPYNFFRNTPENIGKAAAWSAGWMNAKAEDEKRLSQ